MKAGLGLWSGAVLLLSALVVQPQAARADSAAVQGTPEINVQQDSGATTIPHGGVFYVGGNSSEAAHLQNLGSASLNVTYSSLYPLFGEGVSIDPDPIIPENAEGGTGSVPASGSVPFTAVCDSGGSTTETDGEVTIDSDDPDEARYVFLVRCNADQGTETSEINLQQAGRNRLHGATVRFQAGKTVRFTLQNLGENTLFTRLPDVASIDNFLPNRNILNRTSVPIDVPGLNDAQVLVGAGEAPYFEVDCNANVTSEVSTTLIIPNSDPDDGENPYNLTLVCSNQAPEIAVSGPDGAIADGAASYTLIRGESITFTVSNSGSAPLFLGAIAYDPDVTGFTVTDDFDNVDLPTGQSDSVTIQCDTDLANEITTDALIVNDDPDEAPFNIHLTCSPPDVAVSVEGEDLVDGGEVLFAPGESLVFTVTNEGHKEALTLNSLTLTGPGNKFEISEPLDDADMTLGPAESDTFTISCARDVTTRQIQTLLLSTNDGDENPFNITLVCGRDIRKGDSGRHSDEQPAGPNLLCGSSGLVSATTSSPNPIYCRMLVENGAFVGSPAEIGNGDLLAMSLTQVVDIFDLVGNTSGPINVCLSGSGALYFLDATQQPRVLQLLSGVPQGTATCATIPHPGIVALVGGSAPPPPPDGNNAPPSAPSLDGCMVTTTARLNLRSSAATGDNVIGLVPFGVTLTATQRQGDWVLVDAMGVSGWISSSFVTTAGNCGG